MTEDPLQLRLDVSRREIDALIRRGRRMRAAVEVDVVRTWQIDCAAVINQLSGGSKAHWLARAYSGAFLVRAADGGVVVEAEATEIIDRILEVLELAEGSLSRMDDVALASAAPVARRFEFVHNAKLRPVLERALAESARAFEDGDFKSALMTSCGILEAIITDALERNATTVATATTAGSPAGIAEWSFETRIAAAQKAGLIRAGCTRLPRVARAYRDVEGSDGPSAPEVTVSAHEARIARQVLHIIIRDLDPGR